MTINRKTVDYNPFAGLRVAITGGTSGLGLALVILLLLLRQELGPGRGRPGDGHDDGRELDPSADPHGSKYPLCENGGWASDAGPARDPIEIEQAGDQTSRERGADGEEINEIPRQRIDRRPEDDRRIFRIAREPARVERDQQQDAGYCEKQAAEQFGPVQRPIAQIGDGGP